MRVSGMCVSGMRASEMRTIGREKSTTGDARCVRVGYVWSGGRDACDAYEWDACASHMCTVVVACECLEYAHRWVSECRLCVRGLL